MAHCHTMICQQVTLSGEAEWPKVADAVIEAVALRQKAVAAPRSVNGDDPGVVGLLRRPTPDETPVGTSTRHPPQPDRAARVPTDPPLGLPTLGGHQSRDPFRARARHNSHGGSHRPTKKDSPALWANSMPDISNFSRLGAAQCRFQSRLHQFSKVVINQRQMRHCP